MWNLTPEDIPTYQFLADVQKTKIVSNMYKNNSPLQDAAMTLFVLLKFYKNIKLKNKTKL